MPDITPTGAVDVVVRQVRRVRRRKNSYELQRLVFLTIAAGATTAALLLPVALFAPARAFAVAAWTGAATLAGATVVLSLRMRRRWLARAAAIRWVDEHGALAGRLRTLTEIGDGPATRFFLPLLASEVTRDLGRWAPRRLVPRGVPRGAAAAALLACLGLALVLRLAATATPALPEVVFGDTPRAGSEIATPADAVGAGQVLVAPPPDGDDGNPEAPGSAGDAGGTSTLASLPSALQESVRKHVWGEAWERVRDTLARAGEHGGDGGGSTMAAGDDAEHAEPSSGERGEWEIARAPSGALTRRRRPAISRPPAEDGGRAAAASRKPSTAADADDDAGDAGADGGTTAGNGVGPPLYGPPDVGAGDGAGSFELSLAARMRALRGGDRPPGGQAPPADPDTRPELADDQHRESAAHRMAVPAAYEPVVREVFAHRRPAAEQP